MSADAGGPLLNPLASLRRFVMPRAPQERCELCDAVLAADHSHLVERSTRQLVCACEACALLFDSQVTRKYRRVPRRVDYLSQLRLPDSTWEELNLPIDLAFFLHSTTAGRVLALYPSPAGALEAVVSAEAWEKVVEDNPNLRDLTPDVEALLVNRVGGQRLYFRTGIDHCYHLVGLIRTHWRGLSGGPEVWEAVGRFFSELKEKSGGGGGSAHA
jgi:hypothetical protein